MNVKLDIIPSVTAGFQLPEQVELLDHVDPREGSLVIVEALREKTVYNQLELCTGEMVRVRQGDVIAGVLGERRALKGFVGSVPARVEIGGTLHLLNLGGTVGLVSSANQDYGSPLEVRVLGSARLPFRKNGYCPNIKDYALPWSDHLTASAPIVMVSGTSMNSGKTTVAARLIQDLAADGHRVAAAKLTGIALQRDLIAMKDQGAVHALSFVEAGLPSTTNLADVLPAAKGVLAELNQIPDLDAIVVELGDGILGGYGVDLFLRDEEILSHTRVHILCANDPVGAWGADRIFREEYGLKIDIISGPTTDNETGINYITNQLGVSCANARNGSDLVQMVAEKLTL